MIRYTLKCENSHQFDSWFQSADAFEKLTSRGLASCPLCGTSKVGKALMAPRVATRDLSRPAVERKTKDAAPSPPEGPLSVPSTPLEHAVEKLRADIEKNSDYVGKSFASEARRMHEGETPTRSIYGEAKLDEARALAEDGVPVVPLPFGPRDKAN